MKNETIIKIMEKFVDSGWCLEPDGINRMPEKPEETEFYHILSSFLEPRCKEDFSKKEKHRLELIEYLLEGKKIIRKTADSADQKEPEYWALQWNGKTIESVGFARLVYPGWQMFLDFLADPTPWTVDAADIVWEPDLPTNILQSGGVMNDRESFGFKPGEQVKAQKLEKKFELD